MANNPAGKYKFKVNNRKTRTRCAMCLKLAIKTPVVLISLLLALNIFHTLFTPISVVNFEQVNAFWEKKLFPYMMMRESCPITYYCMQKVRNICSMMDMIMMTIVDVKNVRM